MLENGQGDAQVAAAQIYCTSTPHSIHEDTALLVEWHIIGGAEHPTFS